MTYYWDMDGVLANFHKAYATDKAVALKREAMANLEPFAANVATLRALIAAGNTCYILTKAANADGAQGKVEWLAKFVPEMDEAHTIIITKGRKVDNIREDGILVDDDPTNTRQWEKAGHTAILLTAKGEAVRV
jgi:5'(3')-deoxyribonucleotidase